MSVVTDYAKPIPKHLMDTQTSNMIVLCMRLPALFEGNHHVMRKA